MSRSDTEEQASSTRRVVAGILVAGAGLLGLSGVAVSAAATHAGGGTLATTAGLFCLLHAASILGLVAAMTTTSAPRTFGLAAVILLVGTAIFVADLGAAGFFDWRPVPMAAPIGGAMLIAGWGLTVIAGVMTSLPRRRS